MAKPYSTIKLTKREHMFLQQMVIKIEKTLTERKETRSLHLAEVQLKILVESLAFKLNFA